MKNAFQVTLTIVGIAAAFLVAQTLPTLTSAQTTTSTTPIDLHSLAPTNQLTAEDLNVPNPGLLTFAWIRIERALSFSIINKIKLTDKLTSMRLLVAQNDMTNNNKAGANQAINDFENEKTQINKLLDKIDKTNNINVLVAKDSLKQIAVLDTLKQSSDIVATGLPNSIAKKAVDELNDMDVPTIKNVIKDVNQTIASKETDITKKVEQELELDENLNDVETEIEKTHGTIINSNNFKTALNDHQNEVEDAIAQTDPATIAQISNVLTQKLDKHLIVLQELLAKVPDAAKNDLQNAIDNSIKTLARKLAQDKGTLNSLFEGEQVSSEVKDKIINQLKEESGSNQPAVEQAIEQLKKVDEAQKEADQKAVEQAKEAAQKQQEQSNHQQEQNQEQQKNQEEKAKNNQSNDNSHGEDSNSNPAPTATPAQSNTSSSNDSTEVKKEDITIEIESMMFKDLSYSVPNGAQVTVKFKNSDDVSHSLVLDNYGLNTAAIGKDQEASLTFTATKNTTFSCGVHPSIPKGTINIQ